MLWTAVFISFCFMQYIIIKRYYRALCCMLCGAFNYVKTGEIFYCCLTWWCLIVRCNSDRAVLSPRNTCYDIARIGHNEHAQWTLSACACLRWVANSYTRALKKLPRGKWQICSSIRLLDPREYQQNLAAQSRESKIAPTSWKPCTSKISFSLCWFSGPFTAPRATSDRR